uniref:Ras-related protein Rab-21 n=1 Tax=Albugo laibachii Nc14 TaxID=890382 RepID=F0X0P3_9STRA|nr:ras family GTPase putative [Albugo laibachii Nc14]|eukprot:CCA27337.1 ras family GTPase putative [Albugo laibachii Nc14]
MAEFQSRPIRKFKIVLLGEGRVGKTSILLRYIKGEYTDQQVSTLQASYLDKRLMVDNTRVQLSIWDTAGQERFHALGPIYYRDADGAVLVYDITDEESFRKVRTWVKELRRIVGDEIDILIAGNKSDLHRNRKVNEEEANNYAASVGATHFSTSAKLNRGLEEVFVDLSRRMLRRKSSATRRGKTSALIASDDEGVQSRMPMSGGAKIASNATQRLSQSITKTAPRSVPTSWQVKSADSRSESGGNTRDFRSSRGGRLQAQATEQETQFVDDDGLLDGYKERPSASAGLRVRGASSNAEPGRTKSNCC